VVKGQMSDVLQGDDAGEQKSSLDIAEGYYGY
jgi:hypothetical protein